jgi:hypothetical protein
MKERTTVRTVASNPAKLEPVQISKPKIHAPRLESRFGSNCLLCRAGGVTAFDCANAPVHTTRATCVTRVTRASRSTRTTRTTRATHAIHATLVVRVSRPSRDAHRGVHCASLGANRRSNHS